MWRPMWMCEHMSLGLVAPICAICHNCWGERSALRSDGDRHYMENHLAVSGNMLHVTHCPLSVQVVNVCSSPHITASQTYRPNTASGYLSLITHTGMVQGDIRWQCCLGQRYKASSWADCDLETTVKLEFLWAAGTACEVSIPEWENYTFMLTVDDHGRKNMVQRNNATQATRQLRRIIVMLR